MIDKPWTPVAPGWVIVTANEVHRPQWYHLAGWTQDGEPVVNGTTGIHTWSYMNGEDPWCLATHEEWVTGAGH